MYNKLLPILFAVLLLLGGCGNADHAGKKIGSGKIEAPVYTIEAPAAGMILGLISEPGERITRGQPLFAIADEATDSKVESTATKLAKAKADLKSMEEPSQTGSSPGNLSAAQSRYDAARRNADKMNSLLAQGAVSRRQAQAAQAEFAAAQAALQAASQHNILLRPSSPEAIASQKQLIEQLQAEQQALQAKQLQNEAVSPCTGIITEIIAANNETAAAGQPVLTITAADTCTIKLNITGSQLQPQQKVMIHADGFPPFPGQIQTVTGTEVIVFSDMKPEDIDNGSYADIILEQ